MCSSICNCDRAKEKLSFVKRMMHACLLSAELKSVIGIMAENREQASTAKLEFIQIHSEAPLQPSYNFI